MVEEDVRALFNDRFLPAFKNEYPAMGNTDFYIDETNQDIDGAGSPGLVMVTQEPANKRITWFCLPLLTRSRTAWLRWSTQGKARIALRPWMPVGRSTKPGRI